MDSPNEIGKFYRKAKKKSRGFVVRRCRKEKSKKREPIPKLKASR